MINLSQNVLFLLRKSKNLLAFSAGVDSSALFFILIENKIPFDIALVDYGIREQSQKEKIYAMTLSKKYNLQLYTTKAPNYQNNFEKNARDFRYSFFDNLIETHHYNNLITAHQLNDQLEWLLMRLSKGAGASELLGLEPISKRKNYRVVRPILDHSKDELIEYLEKNNHRYFIDQSNSDEKYERNYFRNHFANKLISKYREGIKKSFKYLQEDKKILMGGYREIFNHKELYILEIENPTATIRIVDKYLKKLGYLLSSAQREELIEEKSIVFGGEWAVEIFGDRVYIAPYIKSVIPKRYREACRIAKLPSKVRGYFYREGLEPKLYGSI
jgi:tRNA(Ile)-lysidine synthase